jgi:acyl transferase domain-containing protein
MESNGGLNIQIDDELKDFVPTGTATEVNLESEAVVIDPSKVAAAVAAEDNHDLDNLDTGIIDDTKKEEKKEELEDDDDLDIPEGKKDEEKEVEEEEEKEGGLYKDVAKHFYDEGILSDLDEDMEDSPEAFQQMIEKTVEKKIADYKDSFQNPTSKQFLEFIENGGDPSQFIQATSGVDYAKIDPEGVSDDIDSQKQILRNWYADQGEDPQDAEDMIQAFEDSGHLEKRSLTGLKKLQRKQEAAKEELIEQQKVQAATRREDNQKILTKLKTDIDSSDDIGGFPVNKKQKGDFYDYITKVNPKTGKTGLMEDSSDEKNQMLMSYLYFNKFNFSKLEKKAKTKETKNLEATLGRYSDGSAKQKSRQRTKADKSDPGKLNLGVMKKLFK